jgi:hypothetical protein
MSQYKIRDYSYEQARRLGVEIKPSKDSEKKIDVYKKGERLASIGSMGYLDYPSYMEMDKNLAKKKRKAYKARHSKFSSVKNSPSYFASQILW